MRYVIAGAEGFIGRHLGRWCARLGHDVLGLDAAPRGGAFPLRRWDAVTDEIELPRGTDAVFYLAQSPAYRSFPRGAGHLFSVNVAGALRAAESAAAAGAGLFCYASSGNVYRPAFVPIAEDHPLRRDDPYALSKVAAEEALAIFARTMRVVCVRLFSVFGPGQQQRLVPTIIERVRRRQPVQIERNPRDTDDTGGLRLSLSYVEDVVSVLERLARHRGEVPFALNVAGPEAVSIRGLAGRVGELLGIEPVFEVTAACRAGDLVADTTRMRGLFPGPATPLGEAIARTLGVTAAAGS